MVDFVLPISQKDILTCQLLVDELKEQRADDATAWEQPLVSLTKGIELHYQHELLIDLLSRLPTAVTESLFSRLLSSSTFNYTCLNTLLIYMNSLSKEAKTHQTELITILLNSRIIFLNQPEIEKLLLLLDEKNQLSLLTHLHYQAEQNTCQSHQNPNQTRLGRTYASNYKQLLRFLTLQITQNEATSLTALNAPPRLANLLMGQLLEMETDVSRQQALLLSILKTQQLYDWSDYYFIEKIEPILISQIAIIPASEIKEWFQLYLIIQKPQPNARIKSIQFLDKLYRATNNANIIANCLDTANPDSHQMAFDFLMHSKIQDRFLRQQCLKRINIEQLGRYHKKMVLSGAMGHYPDEGLISDFILLFCTHINKLLAPQKLLQQLALMINSSPQNTAQLAIKIALKQLSSSTLIGQWLQVLIAVNRNNTPLIPHCISFIKEQPDEIELTVNILKGFSDKDLLALYLTMFTQKLDKSYFSCFKELFKSTEKQCQLFYLLKNTPLIHPELLDEFVSALDDKTLLDLIGDLLVHAQPYSEYKTTINQVLLIFCQRLYSSPEPTAAINQWQQRPFAKSLVDALLETPECVSQLTTYYSTVYSLVTWTNPEDAIKHRMDAVLNCYELEADKLKQIATIWLIHFHDNGDQINSLFNTLQATQSNRTSIGKKNLFGIMMACWELMVPERSYNEEGFFALTQAPRPEYFNAAITLASQLQYLKKEPYLGSLMLAKARGIPPNIDAKTFIVLLAHSPNTQISWRKAAFWLKKLSREEQLNFIKQLLDHIHSCTNNPILSKQTYRFIVHHPLFDTFLSQLDPAHWYWLFQNIPENQLMVQATTWLDILIAEHGAHKLNVGKILSVLPLNTSLLATIIEKKTLASPELLARITSQLSVEGNGNIPLMCLQHYVKKHDKSWRQSFLLALLNPTNKLSDGSHINCLLLHMLQDLLIDENSALFPQNSSDQNIIIAYLKLLDTQITSVEENKNFAELNQLMFSTITMLIDKDTRWEPLISRENAYWHTLLRFISNFDLNGLSISEHPLMHLLTHCSTTQLASQLTNNPLWQKILQLILFNPPERLSAQQFTVLFNWLLPESKTQLSQRLLKQTRLSEVHIQSLSVLIDVLSPVELFSLIVSHQHSSLIAKRLLTHQDGLDNLSSSQQVQLFTYIRDSNDLLSILNGPFSIDTRSKFVRSLFQIYGQNANGLSRILEQWFITPEAIVALANFIFEQKDQQTLDEVLQDKPYYRDYINEYLQQPTLDMALNEHSYLSQIQATSHHVANEEESAQLDPAHAIEQQITYVSNRSEQIMQLDFSYSADAYNNERLDDLADLYLPNELLINCLNSYNALFITSAPPPHVYLKNLDKILKTPQKNQEILPHLNIQLIQYIIQAAINYPALYSALLEKFIHSPHKELTLDSLQMALTKQIEPIQTPQPTSIRELSTEQIEAYSSEKLDTILSLQYLLFLNNPIKELHYFAAQETQHDREKQLFCADISLYVSLLSIEKKGLLPLKKSTSWLTQHAQKSSGAYTATILNLMSKDKVEYPLVQYYWLCWDSFVAGTASRDLSPIINGFLHWLSTLEEGQFNSAEELNNLLEHIKEQNILSAVLKKVLDHPQTLTLTQTTWLCERCIQMAPQETSLFPIIINLSSWSWLENYMKKDEPQNFELLKAALGNSAYIININLSETNQQAFISSLKVNQFTSQQILTLVELAQNQQVRSLLIMHLLSKQEYLTSLKGESILDRLDNAQPYSPSRIIPLVHQLDINLLSQSIIDTLPSETAISILCSIPHFHQLTEEQIALLLKKYPHPTVITYWLSHYSSMPNAHCTLAHLINIVDPHVSSALNNMNERGRETIICKIIRHLELFTSMPTVLMEQREERHLILAIRLFLNGHQHSNYINYINQLTDKLLQENHSFTLHAIQLLISLCSHPEFSELNSKTSLLTSHHLKAHAQSGAIGLFYDEGKLNFERMNQPVQLKAVSIPQTEKKVGFFASLLGVTTNAPQKVDTEASVNEHSLIADLISRRRPISSFYYFLIHFKGDRSKVSKVINDYLCFHTQEIGSRSRRRLVHQIADLMIKPELGPIMRDELYTAFLRYPDLFDPQISYALFVFDTQRTIQHFGLKGGEKNYTQVISLCTLALQKLNPKQHQELIDLATKAQQEAERELNFSQDPGFFTRLFMRFIRCWYYGWTGFFVPNSPTYVAPASIESTPPVDELELDDAPMLAMLNYKPEPSVTELLKESTLAPTQEYLEQLAAAIEALSLQAKIKNESEVRLKVNELFLQLHEQSKENNMLNSWLIKNQTLLATNLCRIFELALVKDQLSSVISLLGQIKESAPTLQTIVDELTCPLPLQQEKQLAETAVPQESESSHLATLEATLEATIETTSGMAHNAYSWARDGFSSLFKPLTLSFITHTQDESTVGLAMDKSI